MAFPTPFAQPPLDLTGAPASDGHARTPPSPESSKRRRTSPRAVDGDSKTEPTHSHDWRALGELDATPYILSAAQPSPPHSVTSLQGVAVAPSECGEWYTPNVLWGQAGVFGLVGAALLLLRPPHPKLTLSRACCHAIRCPSCAPTLTASTAGCCKTR